MKFEGCKYVGPFGGCKLWRLEIIALIAWFNARTPSDGITKEVCDVEVSFLLFFQWSFLKHSLVLIYIVGFRFTKVIFLWVRKTW